MSTNFISGLKERILDGGEITFEEAIHLIQIEDPAELEELCASAHDITFRFHPREPSLCSLVNAKSYLCKEDCHFCAQSVHFHTGAARYQLMSVEGILQAAKQAEKSGIRNFCVVTSGSQLNDQEFEQIVEAFKRLRAETSLEVDGSLGFLTADRIRRLKDAGMRRFNSNLQTSREFYPKIVSTHSYEKRLKNLDLLKEAGMEICSGGILNLGESREDRVKLAFALKPYAPHCLPVNILNPRPGTPLENQPRPEPMEMIKTIAVFRFIHPKTNIKLAGGRELNLGRHYQELALRSGANGLVVGGYLTTGADPLAQDCQMLECAGFQMSKTEPLVAESTS